MKTICKMWNSMSTELTAMMIKTYNSQLTHLDVEGCVFLASSHALPPLQLWLPAQ